MIPAFDEVLKKVKAEKNKAGEVYDDLIKAGKVPMIVKDPKYKPPKDGEKSGK